MPTFHISTTRIWKLDVRLNKIMKYSHEKYMCAKDWTCAVTWMSYIIIDTWGVPFKSLKVLWHEMSLKIESDIKASQNYIDNIAILPIVGSILLAT